MGLIEEDEEEDQDSDLYSSTDKKNGRASYAELLDFRLNNQFSFEEIQIDEDGTRIEASTNHQGRFISMAEMKLKKDWESSNSKATKSKYYFQYRIDEINYSQGKDQKNPRVCIGICDENFLVN